MKKIYFLLFATVFAFSATAANYTSVDLGLSVRWATCNVGASTPEGTGNRYAWGETATKTSYSWDTYQYGTAYNALTKYCNNSNYGTEDNLTTLEAADDAATVNWNNGWRMPTQAEWQELHTQCTWKWTDNYNNTNVKGYTVTAANGNAIFLPVTGFGYSDKTQQTDEGYYWSSSLHTTPSDAYYTQFSSTSIAASNDNLRFYGQAVRPVQDIFSVTLVTPKNGYLKSNKTQAVYGETVTLTVVSDSHYILQKLSVMQGTTEIPTTIINGGAYYSFTMPLGNVVLTAEFQRIAPNYTPHPFTVNAAGKQVYFSSGNLQCAGLTTNDTVWSFAEYQTDRLGTANDGGSTLADRIDLFGWSAAGDRNNAPWGVSTSVSLTDYAGDFVEWGQNAIGTAEPNTYRTLTADEWYFLIHTRTNADTRMGVGTVYLDNAGWKGVEGLVLLPDYLTPPRTFKTGFGHGWPSEEELMENPGLLDSPPAGYDKQTFTLVQWQSLEALGAVFLPVSLYRTITHVKEDPEEEYVSRYWSSTPDGTYKSNYLDLSAYDASIQSGYRYWGYAVRLVQDIQYGIMLIASGNGSVLSDVEQCATGDKVTLTITPATGYSLGELTVTDANGQPVTVADDYTFAMPASEVTVNASFEPQTATAVQSAETTELHTENGRIVCSSDFRIYDLLGHDITHRNGQLNGVYIVRIGTTAQKISVSRKPQ